MGAEALWPNVLVMEPHHCTQKTDRASKVASFVYVPDSLLPAERIEGGICLPACAFGNTALPPTCTRRGTPSRTPHSTQRSAHLREFNVVQPVLEAAQVGEAKGAESGVAREVKLLPPLNHLHPKADSAKRGCGVYTQGCE